MGHIDDIYAKEAKLRADVCNPDITEIEMPPAFFHQQIGLRTIMCDPIGRIWDTTASPIKVIFDPAEFMRRIAAWLPTLPPAKGKNDG